MNSNVDKNHLTKKMKGALFIGCVFVLIIFSLINSNQHDAILIESLESKTLEGKKVFNKISYKPGWDQDVWEMRQTHDGPHLNSEKWDELKIIVEKSHRPYKVSFHQLQKGKEINYRVGCYLCHSNGPRAIHPNMSSIEAPMTFKNKVLLAFWNLRIKTYGLVMTLPAPELANQLKRTISLAYSGKIDTAKLKVKTCTLCHNDNHWWSRGQLQRQHFLPISYLVSSHRMPLWPFKLGKDETNELAEFTFSH